LGFVKRKIRYLERKIKNNQTFEVINNPPIDDLQRFFVLSGKNCHLHPGYLQALYKPKINLLVFQVLQRDRIIAFGIAREHGHRLARRLGFSTLPLILESDDKVGACFWTGLKTYCKSKKILWLDMNAFNSTPTIVPNLGVLNSFTVRREFILKPEEIKLIGKRALSSNHRRNIGKGKKIGLSFEYSANFKACQDHAKLVRHSMIRRKNRGELVSLNQSPDRFFSLTESGVGYFARALLNNDCVSSALILQTTSQAYFQSGGSSPKGMQVGASHSLIWEVIYYLAGKEVPVFNLGGVTENDSPGLMRFKNGFGGKEIELPHRSFIIGNRWRNHTIKAVYLLRSSVLEFLHKVVPQFFKKECGYLKSSS